MSTVSRIPNQNVLAIQPGAGFHNSIYRGKNLGSSVSSAQWAAISAGTFEDLFIGDYWTINSANWRIAAFDYWLNTGQTNLTTHHVVIVPDIAIAYSPINSTNTTVGGYTGTNFYTGANGNTGKATAISVINNAFGSDHVLSHLNFFTNAVTDGKASGGAWYSSKVDLMSDVMVTGAFVTTTSSTSELGVDSGQLPLFRLSHNSIFYRGNWWLRDVTGAQTWSVITDTALIGATQASNNRGIRPAFGIKA
jgi:hypothetical protein